MRLLVVAAAVVAAVGAGSAGPGKRRCSSDVVCVTRVVTASLHATAPPASRGPLPPAGVVFGDPEHGFLGSTGGSIQATVDAGSTWQTVWHAPDTSISWIGLAGDGTVVAAADRGGQHELVTSADGGRTWVVVPASVPRSDAVFFRWNNLRFQFVDARVGFGWPNPYGVGDSSPVIRTTDGGAHWTALDTSFGVSSVDFVSERDGYATGVPPSRQECYSELFRTTDGGDTWAPVAGTCRGYGLWGIDTPDAEHVYLGGGAGYWEANTAFQAVLASGDGGQSWRTLYRRRTGSDDHPIVELHFVDADHGWAETGGCKDGQNAPCSGEVLTTSDGGESWRATGHDGVVLATVGADRAWTCCDRDRVIWRTFDAGRTWEPLARPETVSPNSVSAAWPWITTETEVGRLLSRDGGRTWQHFGAAAPFYREAVPPVIRPGLIAAAEYGGIVRVSHDGGRTWTTRRPLGEIDSLAFADDRHGLVGCSFCTVGLARTDDGGRTWRRLPAAPLPDLGGPAYAPGIAVTWLAQQRALAISRDNGRTWAFESMPNRDVCENPVAAAPRRAWFVCSHLVDDRSISYLLATADGGATWTRIVLPRTAVGTLAASPDGAGPLLMAAERWSPTAAQTIWKSADGGRTWTETWIPAG